MTIILVLEIMHIDGYVQTVFTCDKSRNWSWPPPHFVLLYELIWGKESKSPLSLNYSDGALLYLERNHSKVLKHTFKITRTAPETLSFEEMTFNFLYHMVSFKLS